MNQHLSPTYPPSKCSYPHLSTKLSPTYPPKIRFSTPKNAATLWEAWAILTMGPYKWAIAYR